MKTRIQCPECGKRYLRKQIADLIGSRKGESFTIETEALVCPECGFKTVPREGATQFAIRVADAYREAHGLLTSLEIKAMRKRLGMIQAQFNRFLHVGEASVKRWELGEIQSPAMNQLMLLAVAEEERRRGREACLPREEYLPWGGFEQLQGRMAMQRYDPRHAGVSGRPHGPPSPANSVHSGDSIATSEKW
jgi:putative zinc finger/helix-turn-helix YgiT family protein